VSRRNEGRDGRRTAAEDAAAQRATREQADVLDLRNAVLGQDSVGNRQISAEEANDLKRGASKEGVDAAAVLNFSRSLADLANEVDDPDLDQDEQKEHEAQIARETAVAEDIDQDAGDPEETEEQLRVKKKKKKKASRTHLPTDKKTAGMGGGDGPADSGDGEVGPTAPRRADTVDGLPVIPVVPRKRSNAIDLDSILLAGKDAGVLPAYLRHRAGDRMETLTTSEFTRLFHALNLAGGTTAKAFVLKAALVHRPSTSLVPFAKRLAEAGSSGVKAASPGAEAPDEPPDESGMAHLRLFWDPLATVGVDDDWDRCLEETSTLEPWVVPKWLRGVPRPPLDLCIVALDFALQGALHPEQDTEHGTSDALVKAFEIEGTMHPSLRRWFGSLAARAEDREGLLAAREAMLRARADMARPWQAPSGLGQRQAWR
jgi:hypothetical protein